MIDRLTFIVIAAVANFGLGLFVYAKNPRNPINRHFALFSFAVAAWTLSNGLVSSYAGSAWGSLWARFAFASASMIPMTFLWFSDVFPTAHPYTSRRLLRFFSVVAGASFVVSFTPLMVRSTASVDGALRVVHGPLHLPFAIYLICCFGTSLVVLIRKLRSLTGLQKLQVRYLFAAVLTAAAGATATNLLIPLLLNTSRFSPYGPLLGMLMIAIIAHAIIRHRLLDIQLVIRNGVVYVGAIVVTASIFFALAEALHLLTGVQRTAIPILEALAIAIAVSIFFGPVKDRLQTALNRYVYRHTYDYQQTVRETTLRLSTMLDLPSLLGYLAEVIEQTFKVDLVQIYLRNDESRTFTAQDISTHRHWRTSQSALAVPYDSILSTYLRIHRQTLLRDDGTASDTDPRLATAAEELDRLGGDIVFPLFQDELLAGFIVIGAKRSGDPYYPRDIDLLTTLASQAAVAMKNAHLYTQVVVVNEYVDNILSTMESGVIAVDASGHISLFNPAAHRLTGLRFASTTGLSYRDLPAPLAGPLRNTLLEESSHSQLETLLQTDDGSATPLVYSTTKLRDKDGRTHGALIVFSDLSRLKELEREKQRAERLASFGALAAGVAHEIKNPLVAIRTFAELLPERFGDVDFREDFSKVVIKEISRIDDLVARLRGLAATAPQQVGAVDLRDPINDTLTLLRGQLEQTRTAVVREFQDPAPFVSIEESQLKQLFLNLLLNAIEAMGTDGTLTVRINRKHSQGVSWIVIEVADTGPGISDAVAANIFDPFFTTKSRGSGLGLTICRGITDAHRGTIRAERNVAGRGTTMVVELPVPSTAAEMLQKTALRG
ncbi:MAG TPA: ATP-binding protein [Nitrospiraceae bacterium]